MFKHEQQCFIGFKTRGDITEFFKPDKTGAASFLNGFRNLKSYEFIDKVILKINLVWDIKTSEKFIKNMQWTCLSLHIKTHI